MVKKEARLEYFIWQFEMNFACLNNLIKNRRLHNNQLSELCVEFTIKLSKLR